jgi:hypothetical protein
MLPKLREVKYQGDYLIWLKFEDGVEGEVNLESELWGAVFEVLKDKAHFAEFSLDGELETIVWPNGADFAPEFLYQKLCPDYVLKPMPKNGRSLGRCSCHPQQ